MRHFCRHADAFAQRGVWVDGLTDVHRVCTHFEAWSSVMPIQAISGSVQDSLTAV
jgi:hypothetical protein